MVGGNGDKSLRRTLGLRTGRMIRRQRRSHRSVFELQAGHRRFEPRFCATSHPVFRRGASREMLTGPMLRLVFALFFFLCMVTIGWGDSRLSVELSSLLTAISTPSEDTWSMAGVGTGTVRFEASGLKNVKAQLDMDLVVTDRALLDVSRFYVKVRFPWFRATVGKNRISWGEGTMFNAADLIAASSGVVTDLTQDMYHDQGVWMVETYIPVGRFSFIELALLPPVPDLLTMTIPAIDELEAGGRVYFKPLGIKMEAGYLYSGKEGMHFLYAGVQGHLFVDWHLSASTGIPEKGADWDDLPEGLSISAGVYKLHNFRSGASLLLRLESMIRPNGLWEPMTLEDGSASLAGVGSEEYTPSTQSGTPDTDTHPAEAYGLLLYPELVFSPITSLSILGRSIISPVDGSALVTAGVQWNVFQGFDLLGFITIQAGGPKDAFGWDRDGDVSAVMGFRVTF